MRKYAGKVMATVFWDRKGVLLVDFVGKNHNKAASYFAIPERLRAAIQRQRPALLTTGVASAG